MVLIFYLGRERWRAGRIGPAEDGIFDGIVRIEGKENREERVIGYLDRLRLQARPSAHRFYASEGGPEH